MGKKNKLQGGAVNDRVALQGVAATPVAQRPGGRPSTLRESSGELTAKVCFAE